MITKKQVTSRGQTQIVYLICDVKCVMTGRDLHWKGRRIHRWESRWDEGKRIVSMPVRLGTYWGSVISFDYFPWFISYSSLLLHSRHRPQCGTRFPGKIFVVRISCINIPQDGLPGTLHFVGYLIFGYLANLYFNDHIVEGKRIQSPSHRRHKLESRSTDAIFSPKNSGISLELLRIQSRDGCILCNDDEEAQFSLEYF